ncbi:MAG TPA: serine protein kinase RIO [Candidatus Thermoplasmatota archaeon]|nr:serine protein kinase RIO [Candidatus Thermoplasmatota archaeon]
MPRAREPDPEEQLEFVEQRIRSARQAGKRDFLRDERARKVEDEVFDRATLLALWKLIHKGVVATLDYPISTGKEANVFHATDPKGKALAVKIFRISNATFYAFKEYISGDPRFESVAGNRRQLVYLWVRKEYKNLLRLHDVGIPVPTPITSTANVLCMEFLGEQGTPAPLLKDAEIEDPTGAYEDMIAHVRLAWQEADLVHGDLSEFNVVVHGGKPFWIDVGQAVVTRHPMSREFLLRDVRNVTRFFARHGAKVRPAEEVVAELVAPKKTTATDGEARPRSRRPSR